MDLTTQCPQCGSAFSVSLEQLQLRKGYIRCTNCAYIFDGYEAVVPSVVPNTATTTAAVGAPQVVRQRSSGRLQPQPRPYTAPAASTAEPITAASNSPTAILRSVDPDHTIEVATGAIDQAFTISATRPSVDVEPTGPRITFRGQAPEAPEAPSFYMEPRSQDLSYDNPPLPEFLTSRHQRGHRFMRFVWGILVLIGLLFLLAQLVYVYRAQLASNVPILRPVLEQACQPLKCTVDYPRRIEHISIMDSSLQAASGVSDATEDSRQLLLRVVLRNTYNKPQEWPMITLELLDFSGVMMVKRILAPHDYLPGQALQGPFAAKSEMRITVPITVAGLKINGYQLGKFFP